MFPIKAENKLKKYSKNEKKIKQRNKRFWRRDEDKRGEDGCILNGLIGGLRKEILNSAAIRQSL